MSTAHPPPTPTPPPTTDIVTSLEAAELLRIPHRLLTKYVRLKQIPHYLLPGGFLSFSASELREWLASRHQPAEGDR